MVKVLLSEQICTQLCRMSIFQTQNITELITLFMFTVDTLNTLLLS